MSNITWEVVLEFNWGVTSKMSYKTRDEARKAMKKSKAVHSDENGTLHPYGKWGLYRVEHLTGLSNITGEGVYLYNKVR